MREAVSAAFSYLARPGAPPDGIAAMRPGKDFLNMLNSPDVTGPYPITAYGGRYDPAANGVGPAFRGGFANGLFGTEPNDLVVSVASATSVGQRALLSNPCSHSDYVDDPDVRRALLAWR